jgi:membrane protein DedA with SNARE-associated domain
MTFTDFLSQYGYLGLFGGCLLEGETLLLLAGIFAHQGYLSYPIVVVVAFVGGTLGDQICFFVGRRYGEPLLERWPKWEAPATRVRRMIERHSAWLIVGVRFMYGLRLIGPVVIGMSSVGPLRFAVFNLIGAAIWALAVSGLGYLFGHAIEWFLADLAALEKWGLLGVVAVVVVLMARRRARRRAGP